LGVAPVAWLTRFRPNRYPSFDWSAPVDDVAIKKLEAHLKRTFGNPHIAVKARKQKDSAEVEMKGEFIGVIYVDEDEDGSYMFEMAILAEDLE
jgi:hypothetical protein